MSVTWRSADEPSAPPVGAMGWARAILLGGALTGLILGGLAVLLTLRLAERPFHGPARPWSAWVARAVSRGALAILGIGYRRIGTPATGAGALVANHSSWLDIFALNAGQRLSFVSKSEVAGWPGIGWLARAAGTLFIARDPRRAREQAAQIAGRLATGARLAIFPEGTSTDGRRVLGFKSTPFAGLLSGPSGRALSVQPVTLIWHPPPGAEPRFYGWWGDMDFAGHLLQVLAARRQGRVEVIYHPPLAGDGFGDRKALARACEAAVREGFGAAHPDPA